MDKVIQELVNQISDQSKLSSGAYIPSVGLKDIDHVLDLFKKALFPGVFYRLEQRSLERGIESIIYTLKFALQDLLIRFDYTSPNNFKLCQDIITSLPQLKQALWLDIDAIFQGDPAAETHEEVMLSYPSFEAIMIYRIAHQLLQFKCTLFARMCTSIAHRQTGIDIHPKAKIGHSFCIDHGSGLVIGETAVIGNYVKMYQGVTIGALSVSKRLKNVKRHPTIEDYVTIYARTTILGGDTTIGAHSIIGGNVWLTKSVPSHSKIYNTGFDIDS